MDQLNFPDMPLSTDEQTMLNRMKGWVPSGIGSITFIDITFQLRWRRNRAAFVFQSLIEKGLIHGPGHVGEYFVTPQRHGNVMQSDAV